MADPNSDDPLAILAAYRGKASPRLFRLFAIACLSQSADDPVLAVARRMAEGAVAEAERSAAQAAIVSNDGTDRWAHYTLQKLTAVVAADAYEAARDVASASLSHAGSRGLWESSCMGYATTEERENGMDRAIRDERQRQLSLLKDISFGRSGPDGRPPLSQAVSELAWEMYGECDRGFERARMAALADLLEAAGCADRAVADHCRSEGPHVRGCWAVDWVLDKR